MKSEINTSYKEKQREAYIRYGIEEEPATNTIKSVFGEEIKLTNKNGTWVNKIVIFIPGIGNKSITGLSKISSHFAIDHSARNFINQYISSNAELIGINGLIESLKELNIDPLNEEKATQQISKWIHKTLTVVDPKNSAVPTVIKQYVEFCVDESYWAFDECLIWKIPKSTPLKNKSLHKTSLLDPIYGPFTQNEILQISNAINNPEKKLSFFEKSLIMLCRDLGLRPVQIALLRTEDLFMTKNGPKIKIPRVKGCSALLRRNVKNFVERDISENLYLALKATINESEPIITNHKKNIKEYCQHENIAFYDPPTPIFCKKSLSEIAFHIYKIKSVREYCLHLTNAQISFSVKSIGKKLMIKNSRNDGPAYIDITAYRFRKSMATNMVLQGYAPEEVAHALDHLTLGSVSHYFKFNTEVIDFVNSVVNNSFEISQMVDYWKGRFVSKKEATKLSEMRTVGTIGLCSKTETCDANPTITCYSCNNFKPYADGTHQEALEEIVRFKEDIAIYSTGPVKNQIELSYEMAKQCVTAQKGYSEK